MRVVWIILGLIVVFLLLKVYMGGYKTIYEQVFGSKPPYQEQIEKIISAK